jgi:hypothetical protein
MTEEADLGVKQGPKSLPHWYVKYDGLDNSGNSEILRIPRCLDNPLESGGEVVSLTHTGSAPLPRNRLSLFKFWYTFLLEAE